MQGQRINFSQIVKNKRFTMMHRRENLFLKRPIKIWPQFFFCIFLIFDLSSHKLPSLKSLLFRHYSNPSLDIAFIVGRIICNIFKLSNEIVIINVVNITIIGLLQINPTQKIMSGQIEHIFIFFKSSCVKFFFAKLLKLFFIHILKFYLSHLSSLPLVSLLFLKKLLEKQT